MALSWVVKRKYVMERDLKMEYNGNKYEVTQYFGDMVKHVDINTILNSDFVRYVVGTDTYTVTETLGDMLEIENNLGSCFDKIYEVNNVFIGATFFD